MHEALKQAVIEAANSEPVARSVAGASAVIGVASILGYIQTILSIAATLAAFILSAILIKINLKKLKDKIDDHD
jgi:hypothetical protein